METSLEIPEKFITEGASPLLLARVEEEEVRSLDASHSCLPVLSSPQWSIALACIVFLLHNADHLLYLLLSSMFFLSNWNKQFL